MPKKFEIIEEEVEFDEALYQINIEENDFSAWENEVGKGEDK